MEVDNKFKEFRNFVSKGNEKREYIFEDYIPALMADLDTNDETDKFLFEILANYQAGLKTYNEMLTDEIWESDEERDIVYRSAMARMFKELYKKTIEN